MAEGKGRWVEVFGAAIPTVEVLGCFPAFFSEDSPPKPNLINNLSTYRRTSRLPSTRLLVEPRKSEIV